MPIITLLTNLCFLISLGVSTDPPNSIEAGFTEAIFDAQTVQELLNRSNSDGIRFYNSLHEGKVELIAIPISEGADMNRGLFPFKPYVVAMGVSEDRIVTDRISEGDARKRCEALHLSEHEQYAADFSKSSIETLLSNESTNALRIVPKMVDETLSMQMEAANFSRGTTQSVGVGEQFQVIATDPCPPLCGSSANYLFSHE